MADKTARQVERPTLSGCQRRNLGWGGQAVLESGRMADCVLSELHSAAAGLEMSSAVNFCFDLSNKTSSIDFSAPDQTSRLPDQSPPNMRTRVLLNWVAHLGLPSLIRKPIARGVGLSLPILGAIAVMFAPINAAAADKAIYYWISHGSPADPVWTYFLQGAEQWAKDTGNEVRTSFHSGDVPSHQEAVRAAISAKARGIVTSTPDPGSLTKVIAEAHAAGIPVIVMNTEDKTSGRDAYVGGDNVAIGHRWAQYLVDHNFVKKGDFVWMPVEVPGATYQTLETQGIDQVFKPLGINYEITEAKLDQAEIITRMSDYLTANKGKIKAIIGLGDLVTGSIKRVFDQVHVKAGEIPVVGWGNSLDTAQEILDGYVNAAMWQDPQATSYLALSMAAMAASGIPPGFDISVGTLYEKDKAGTYLKIMQGAGHK
jgi:simple sugar transport system substrate-binding protein